MLPKDIIAKRIPNNRSITRELRPLYSAFFDCFVLNFMRT